MTLMVLRIVFQEEKVKVIWYRKVNQEMQIQLHHRTLYHIRVEMLSGEM